LFVCEGDGAIIVADQFNDKIRKIDSNGVVTTIAGSTRGTANGTGTNAKFNWPVGVAIDKDGSIIVADAENNRIRKIDSNGFVTTIAASTWWTYADGAGTNAKFYAPTGIAIDKDGAIIVADYGNNRIRKIDSNGVVTTIAGSDYGYIDGAGTNAEFNLPAGVSIDKDGAIIVADYGNNRIRKIDSNGVVTTIAGSTEGYADGTGTSAQFDGPMGVAIDNNGAIIVGDTENNRIRKIDSNGVVTTIAGSTEGYADGVGTNAEFNLPVGVAIDKDGAIIVADYGNNRIRKIEVK
jgi:sugar lactone lactonase YvrE